jgi:ribosomal-protein-alanine N-acetyltransferase
VPALRPLTQDDAEEIAAWRYPGEYAFYDIAADPVDAAELLDEAGRGDQWTAVVGDDGRLAGFYQLRPRGGAVEIGLGLRPDLCGAGRGQAFVRAGIDLARMRHPGAEIVLAVAEFNRRAIVVYERCGCVETGRHMRYTSGAEWEFVDMTCG